MKSYSVSSQVILTIVTNYILNCRNGLSQGVRSVKITMCSFRANTPSVSFSGFFSYLDFEDFFRLLFKFWKNINS